MAYIKPNILSSGITFGTLQADGAAGHLEALITAQAATVAPTSAHTWNATSGGTSGGSLVASSSATFYSVVTETNGIGETTAGPVSSQITVSAGDIPQITFQTLKTGNTARNVYLGAPGGTTAGPFSLYAMGVTTSTYNCSAAAPTTSYAVQPPTANSTGLTYVDGGGLTECKPLELIRAAKDGNLEDVFRYYGRVLRSFIEGDPVTFNGVMTHLRHAHTAIAMLDTMCNEAGTLIDANAGTISSTTTPIGTPVGTRTW